MYLVVDKASPGSENEGRGTPGKELPPAYEGVDVPEQNVIFCRPIGRFHWLQHAAVTYPRIRFSEVWVTLQYTASRFVFNKAVCSVRRLDHGSGCG